MTLGQFEAAVDMLAEKKYPGDPDGVRKIRTKLTSGAGPTTHGATVQLKYLCELDSVLDIVCRRRRKGGEKEGGKKVGGKEEWREKRDSLASRPFTSTF